MESATMTYDQTYGPRFLCRIRPPIIRKQLYFTLTTLLYSLFDRQWRLSLNADQIPSTEFSVTAIRGLSPADCLAFSCIRVLDLFLLHVLAFKFLHPKNKVVSLRFLPFSHYCSHSCIQIFAKFYAVSIVLYLRSDLIETELRISRFISNH